MNMNQIIGRKYTVLILSKVNGDLWGRFENSDNQFKLPLDQEVIVETQTRRKFEFTLRILIEGSNYDSSV